MLTTKQLMEKAAASEASFKAKIHAIYASIGLAMTGGADYLSALANHVLGWLPSVQAYVKAEYFQYIGSGVAGSMLISSFIQAKAKVRADRLLLSQSLDKADATIAAGVSDVSASVTVMATPPAAVSVTVAEPVAAPAATAASAAPVEPVVVAEPVAELPEPTPNAEQLHG